MLPEVRRLRAAGWSKGAISRELGIPVGTVGGWVSIYGIPAAELTVRLKTGWPKGRRHSQSTCEKISRTKRWNMTADMRARLSEAMTEIWARRKAK
jgi:hypothetical protein